MKVRSRRAAVLMVAIFVGLSILMGASAQAVDPCWTSGVVVHGRTIGKDVCIWPK